jgi:hypothetical protein
MITRRRPAAVSAGPAAGFAALACLVLVSPAGATTLRRMDLPDLVRDADRVVHARAVDKDVFWDPTGTQIQTDTTFEVIDEAKGQGPKRLVVNMLGGQMGQVEMFAEGTPTFDVGDEVVLFTSPRPDGKKNLVGFSQGYMKVFENASGQKYATGMVPMSVTVLDTSGPQPRSVRPVGGKIPLDALMDRVRQIAAQGAAAKPTIEKQPRRLEATPIEKKP